MATIVTREVGATAKGSPLTNTELDNNFINLNDQLLGRTVSISSNATITPTLDSSDVYEVSALATNATIAAPSGTLTNNRKLLIKIKDNGTARTLNWNAIYRAISVTLPTTTVINKTVYVGCIYNFADSTWDVLAVAQT